MLALRGGVPVLSAQDIGAWPSVEERDAEAVLRALRDCVPWRWPMPAARELEDAWSELTGMPYVLATNSGTAALHMALVGAGVRPGDEVLVPADTFPATAQAVLHAGATPVFVDTDPITYAIDPARVPAAVTSRTTAIVAVDLHGLPADYAELEEIARRHGLVVVEDGAQAHGATYRGRPVGALGDLSGLSLNGSKCLSSAGEAGLFAARDRDGWLRARSLMTFGEDPEHAGEGQPEVVSVGWNYRVHVLAAAFARSQLRRLPEMSRVRTENGAALTAALAGLPGLGLPAVPDDRTHVFFLYPLLVRPEELGLAAGAARAFGDLLVRAARAEGLPLRRWQTKPVPDHRLFRERAAPGAFPVAADVCARRLVLGQSSCPLGPPATPASMRRIAEVFHKILGTEAGRFLDLVAGEQR